MVQLNLERQIVLHLLNEQNADPIIGKTRLQKLIFLVDIDMRKEGTKTNFDFEPYKFGPYSSNLNFLTNQMEKENLIERTRIKMNGIDIFSFSITERGKKEIENSPAPKKIISKLSTIKAYCKKMSLDKLVMKVYKQYPKFAVRSELIFRE